MTSYLIFRSYLLPIPEDDQLGEGKSWLVSERVEHCLQNDQKVNLLKVNNQLFGSLPLTGRHRSERYSLTASLNLVIQRRSFTAEPS